MVTIEIDGISLSVDASKTIIQVADEAGVDIPRFCYHKKLSVAANCRMCLVEVAGARSALPACATLVSEGMQIHTQSTVARNAQRAVMEFLLINHPLDCPICDQGGECELQDMSMGYGAGISRFSERKRVVPDKNIGPLIQTDMTRCIHCTRCVRFGQEIAGIKELGATGRGEHMEIGTYVEHSLISELSGNIIDLCPVGALTSKPFRYKARAWEMTAHPSVAPHDAVGSNIEVHVRRNEVMRVVPRDNEALNESWISDRDRFSYLGLNHPERCLKPLIKIHGQWQETDWQTALEFAVEGLKSVKAKNGPEQIAGLISPTATTEEAYLFQKWLRGLGTDNIDHRLRQQDFVDDACDYSLQDWDLSALSRSDTIVMLGCSIRSEQPIIAHRIRQANTRGAAVFDINFVGHELFMSDVHQHVVSPVAMMQMLSGIVKSLLPLAKDIDTCDWLPLLSERTPTAAEQNVAMQLSNANESVILLGELLEQHPQGAKYRKLASLISRLTGAKLVWLPKANSVGHWQAGAIPSPKASKAIPLNALSMWQQSCRAYVLFNVEPELDCVNPVLAMSSLQHASFVVQINNFVTQQMQSYADVILPLAAFTETSGTFISINKKWQSFTGAVAAKGDSRPGWKILRVLGNISRLSDFDYVSSEDVLSTLKTELRIQPHGEQQTYLPEDLQLEQGLTYIAEVPSYRCDSLVRRSSALQNTPEMQELTTVKIHPELAQKLDLQDGQQVLLSQHEQQHALELKLDETVARDCVYLQATTSVSAQLGAAMTRVDIKPAGSLT